MAEDGMLDSESKKQASRLKREMRKIKGNLEGVRNMSRLPGAVVVVDAKKEYLALREAKKLEIATIGLLDTDSDPDTVDVAIPANDDSIRAVDLILHELADAVAIGKTMTAARQEPPQRPRRVRSRRPPMARADKEQKKPTGDENKRPAPTVGAVSQEAQAPQQEPAEKGNQTTTENL
jgi:small subunit ribosomal protein S2